ncbi:MAG: mechanosensitive ion channel [bacterium]|nr:mechanosensitive ion channel [bacterium]MDT8365530.1 mechanosensitive ion channel [bacterium]
MEKFNTLWQAHPKVQTLVWVAVVALVVMLLVKVLQHILVGRIKETETRYRMRKFVSFFAYLIIILYALSAFSDKLQGFAVALGVAGAGIAFALQEVIASVAGWVSLSFGHSLKTCDRVMVGGLRGDVIDVGVLRTTLMELGDWVNADQYNGRIVRVSNSLVFREPVFNYSSDFPFLWDEITVHIRHGSDLLEAGRILERVTQEVVGGYIPEASQYWGQMVNKYYIDKASVEPAVTMTANENWVTFAVRYVVDYKMRRSTKNLLFKSILKEISDSGERVSLAVSSIELSAAPYFDVRILDRDPDEK